MGTIVETAQTVNPAADRYGVSGGHEPMESWRLVWRRGFVATLDTAEFLTLQRGLEHDDPALDLGRTCDPAPLTRTQDAVVVGCCPTVYVAWRRGNVRTVGEVDNLFWRRSQLADHRLGETAAVRWLTNWL